MRILMTPNKEILAILKKQPVFKNVKYRLLTNCLIEDIPEGKILFNGLTRCCITMSNVEFSQIYDINKFSFLYYNYFLVPEDFNELETIDYVREHFKSNIDDLYLERPNAYTILTTTKCNARCFYCYELKVKKHNMSKETAEKVSNYIIQRKPLNNKPIQLHWFGGEPLFNMEAIDIITGALKEKNIPYVSNFTSNGYLFDLDTVIKAKTLWNTSHVQITIDGTEEIYNKVKNYIYKNTNPYNIILNNIELLIKFGIGVTIRMNVDAYNGDNLVQLVKDLHTKFGNNNLFGLYAYPIFENDDYHRTEEEKALVFEKLEDIEKTMIDCGYKVGKEPSPAIASHQCMVDSGNSMTISPLGEFGLCEHCTTYDFWGKIDDPKRDTELFKSWRVYEEPLDICNSCPLYGSCIRPSKCEEMSKCDIYYKEWKIKKAKRGLLYFYKKNIKN